jgi:hypothetical protein
VTVPAAVAEMLGAIVASAGELNSSRRTALAGLAVASASHAYGLAQFFGNPDTRRARARSDAADSTWGALRRRMRAWEVATRNWDHARRTPGPTLTEDDAARLSNLEAAREAEEEALIIAIARCLREFG